MLALVFGDRCSGSIGGALISRLHVLLDLFDWLLRVIFNSVALINANGPSLIFDACHKNVSWQPWAFCPKGLIYLTHTGAVILCNHR